MSSHRTGRTSAAAGSDAGVLLLTPAIGPGRSLCLLASPQLPPFTCYLLLTCRDSAQSRFLIPLTRSGPCYYSSSSLYFSFHNPRTLIIRISLIFCFLDVNSQCELPGMW